LLEHLCIGEAKRRFVRPVNVLLVFWFFLILAIAGPSWKLEPSPFAGEEAGLMVLLKVSRTMEATDVQPSRLERAKFKLKDLLEERKGAPSGLIVYSGSAHLVMPLTKDERIISTMVEDLTPALMPADGDALQSALKLAESIFARAGVPGSIVVIADSVAGVDADSVNLPVQFLSVQSTSSPVDAGMERAASLLRANITRITVDSTDVEKLARRAKSELKSTSQSGRERWKDSGYAIIPFIALCGLLWSRKGWVV
jgi:Ca-activated chloride channel family protein